MKIDFDDTIAAIGTPAGEGAIAVIRVSGPEAFRIAGRCFRPKSGALETAKGFTIHLGSVVDPEGREADQVLASVFCGPHSYTGQDMIEISSHGGLVVSKKILSLLVRAGARHAEPGEFTRRAFLNGKMDLAQAEAVLDLIKAKSERAAETAVRQLRGSLSEEFKQLKEKILKIYAHIEAFLDFPDEDLEIFEDRELARRLDEIDAEMSRLVASFERGSLLREGLNVVIAGKPNVGKSSLFNALLARDRALVSEYPGTTRDSLEEAIEIGGLYLRLTDTAGLADAAAHPLDRMGMERARAVLDAGHLFLFLTDASRPLEEIDRRIFAGIPAGRVLVIVNKCDLPRGMDAEALAQLAGGAPCLKISVKERQGMDQLEARIAETLENAAGSASGEQIIRLRHRDAVAQARTFLRKAAAATRARSPLELVSLDLKASADRLAELIGEVYSEDLLDVIFSEFCIGK